VSLAEPRCAALVVAGGRGLRMGAGQPKQYLELEGEPVLLHALRPFLGHPRLHEVVVVLPPADAAAPPPWLARLGVRLVAGGELRGDSVWNGLQALDGSIDVVLVHDGARPLLTRAVLERVLDAARAGQAAIAALPASDTVQQVDADGVITGTPDRGALWLAQTPQAFPLAGLRRAHARARDAGVAATDDAALYARFEGPVRVVPGSARNLKLTRPLDLVLAGALARLAPGDDEE
jgi:2-C-methyl-D-erythritol 4-phosphate cytidylyltransferase